MTLEEALAEIERLKTENTGVASRLTNAEALIGRQSGELGELRKFKSENEPVLNGLKTEVATLKETISKGGLKPSGDNQGEENDDPDKLEEKLTKEQEAVLDAAYQRAPEEIRKRIVSDPKVRATFIKEAISIASPVPETWRKSTRQDQKKVTDATDDIKNLFKSNRQVRTVPVAGRPGAVREASGRGDGEGQKPSLNPSDVSGSLRRMRESKQAKE